MLTPVVKKSKVWQAGSVLGSLLGAGVFFFLANWFLLSRRMPATRLVLNLGILSLLGLVYFINKKHKKWTW